MKCWILQHHTVDYHLTMEVEVIEVRIKTLWICIFYPNIKLQHSHDSLRLYWDAIFYAKGCIFWRFMSRVEGCLTEYLKTCQSNIYFILLPQTLIKLQPWLYLIKSISMLFCFTIFCRYKSFSISLILVCWWHDIIFSHKCFLLHSGGISDFCHIILHRFIFLTSRPITTVKNFNTHRNPYQSISFTFFNFRSMDRKSFYTTFYR